MIDNLDEIVKDKIGFIPEKTILNVYNNTLWKEFLNKQNFNPETKGVYSPKDYVGYVNENADLPTKIHEYYGHGTFCEHSLIGQKLVNAVRKNKNVEKITNETLFHNEGFALWMEYFLSNRLGLSYIEPQDARLTFAKDCENINDFFLKKEYGFPSSPTKEDAKRIITSLYDQKDIRLAILYGSKKPTSDVDIFIVSDKVSSYVNHWLDIYSVDNQYFNKGINNLMIDITDPLFSGKVIIGHKELEDAKKKVLDKEITNDAIVMNFSASKQEASLKGLSKRDYKISQSYVKTYNLNAIALSQGKKYLTKSEVVKNVRTNS